MTSVNVKKSKVEGQSAAKYLKDLIQGKGSTTIPRKGSTLYKFIMEKPNIRLFPIFPSVPYTRGCIYGITFLGSSKVYIGRTKNLQKRMSKHRDNLMNCTFNSSLFNAYHKYREPYCFVIQNSNSFNDELFWINRFNSYRMGYNQSENTSNNTLGKPAINRIPVIAFRLDGSFYKEFKSVTHAAKFVKTQSTNISKCCKGNLNHIKNYKFVYKKDLDKRKSYRVTLVNKRFVKVGVRKFNSILQAAKYLNIHRHTLKKAINNKHRVNGLKVSFINI